MSSDFHPVVAVVQVRMTSSRLPGKVLKPLAGAPLVRRMIERVLRIDGIDGVAVALAEGAANDPVIDVLSGMGGVTIARGSETDVLSRSAAAARAVKAATVMRITSDCPLLDPAVSAAILAAYKAGHRAGLRYARTSAESGFPHGFDTEVFEAAALYRAEAEATDPYEREHVTPYIWRRPEMFPAMIVDAKPDRRHWRITVDTEDDYRLVHAVYEALHMHNPAFGYADLCRLFDARPELLSINAPPRVAGIAAR